MLSLVGLSLTLPSDNLEMNAGKGIVLYGAMLGRCLSKFTKISTIRQGDQGTTKIGKRISRVVITVRATGFIQCGRGMLRQGLLVHATPTLDGGCVKPVAKTFERALDMRFPTFVVS